MALLLGCIAVLALAYGLSDYIGMFRWSAVSSIFVCTTVALIAVWHKHEVDSDGQFDYSKLTSRMLAAGLIASLVWLLLFRLEVSPALPQGQWLQSVHAVTLVVALWYIFGPRKWKSIVFFSLVTLFAISAVLTIEGFPKPSIDTWYFQQAGANGLLHGENPYVLAYETPYNESEAAVFYGPGVTQNGLLLSYTYPPLNLLLQIPFFALLRDIRYSILAAVVLSALLMRWLSPPNNRSLAELSASFLIFSPVTLFVVRQAWTEPIVLAFWLGLLVAIRKAVECSHENSDSRSQLWVAVILGLLTVIKQYAVLVMLPPLLQTALRRRPWRQVLVAASVTAAVCLPFVIWDPTEFVRDVVFTQFRQPFRLDALSVLAVIARFEPGTAIPKYAVLPAFLTPILLYVLARPSVGRLDQITRTTAAGFLLFIFLNKQAFCNYYWLALGLLCASCATNSIEGIGNLARESSER